ncbi:MULTISPECIES: hypothetical protein [Ponticoccus]|uniref:Uncharacterized protein n=1 Tax=Ponticoccus litoralis TaxID=422297 RepID=A0AAW9SF51_9RHOB
MAVISFMVGSVVALVAASLCWAFSEMGLGGALMVYLGGGTVLGTLLTLLGSGLFSDPANPFELASDRN